MRSLDLELIYSSEPFVSGIFLLVAVLIDFLLPMVFHPEKFMHGSNTSGAARGVEFRVNDLLI